ncbi:MAG: IS110 family transposase [Silvibacterium sp.]|jgi:transposase
MEVQYARCCGIDIHKKSITVCVLIREGGRKEQKHLREFATTTSAILSCADWLRDLGVTHVAMESTGVYWRPVWNLLEGQFDLLLANATHIKNVPGRKTDVKDSEWIAQLLQHGLLRPSFVPNTSLRDLRELSRDRTSLVAERSRLKNRIQKILEEANIKLGSVASDVLGKSGRAMLTAMVEGQQDPQQLAALALGQLRLKIPQLVEALRGRVRAVHRFRLKQQLARIDFIEAQIAELETEIERQNAPFDEAVSLLAEIPGFDRTTAWSVIAEIGIDMNQFPSADHLASWAGVCPGNHESGGKRLSGKTRKGSRWLRQKLCQSAWCASRSKKSYFAAFFQRIAAHRGRKRAIVAVSHSLLVVCYYLLQRKCHFEDLGVNYFDQLNHEKLTRYFVKRLTRLGHRVTIEPCSAAA